MRTNLASLVPVGKSEVDKAAALVQLGYPAVEPVMPQILEWLQDLNWPVGRVFQPFLARIGQPLAPYICAIFSGDDDVWKYNLLQAVVRQSPELARALRPELERVAANPSTGESKEEVDQVAVEILEAINGGATEA